MKLSDFSKAKQKELQDAVFKLMVGFEKTTVTRDYDEDGNFLKEKHTKTYHPPNANLLNALLRGEFDDEKLKVIAEKEQATKAFRETKNRIASAQAEQLENENDSEAELIKVLQKYA